MKFILEGRDDSYYKSYFTEDNKWAVLERVDGLKYLYKENNVGIYEFVEIKIDSWEDINNYISEHS